MAITKAKAQSLLGRIAKLRILVVGDVMLDHYMWGEASRISPEAPVPVVDIYRDTYTAGGAGNVAVNIAGLKARCTLAGFIGSDEAGRRLTTLLEDHGVRKIPTPGNGDTILKTRVLAQHQQLCRLDRESEPVAYRVQPRRLQALLKDEIRNSDAVILSDYAKGILDDQTVECIASLCREERVFVALDPKPRHALKFSHLDLITPNRKEAAFLAGVDLPKGDGAGFNERAEEICRRLHERYHTRYVAITLSEDGLLLSSGGTILKRIPTAAREVYDVSGAGDTSIAALVLALAAGADLETAGHFANAAAGVVVGKLGTASITPKELLAYLDHK